MGENWYLHDLQGQHGPFDRLELIARLRNYIDLSEVIIWGEGFADWLPASQVFGPSLEIKKPKLRRWALYGFVGGLILCASDFIFEWRGKKFGAWEGSGLAENIGYIFGASVSLSIISFLVAAFGRWLTKPSSTYTQTSLSLNQLTRDPHAPDALQSNVRTNFIARYWRGEFPLWISYWIVGLGVNFFAAFVPIFLGGILKSKQAVSPISIFSFYATLWAILSAASVWQLVGLWRSANARIEERAALGKTAPWAGIAKFMVIVGAVQVLGILAKSAVPQLTESASIAFLDDPEIPSYSIRLLANGREVEVSGGIKFGLSDELGKILKASRQLRVIHLDSVGGRIGEGEALNKLIKQYGLTTYVSSRCLSACTLAFAGGTQRILRKDAVLGFHRGSFGGSDQEDNRRSGIERDIFSQAGFSAAFINRALATPNKDMWKPSSSELISAGVVTRISTGQEFAMSGYGNVSREYADNSLQKAASVYVALKEKYPNSYTSLVDDFYAGLSNGENEGAIKQKMSSKLSGYIKLLLPLADDAVIIDFAKLAADEYEMVGKRSLRACYSFASGEGTEDYKQYLSDEISKRELLINESVVRTAAKRPSVGDTDAAWKVVVAGLMSKGVAVDDFKMLDEKNLDETKFGKYCTLASQLYREIASLPARQGVPILRELFSTK